MHSIFLEEYHTTSFFLAEFTVRKFIWPKSNAKNSNKYCNVITFNPTTHYMICKPISQIWPPFHQPIISHFILFSRCKTNASNKISKTITYSTSPTKAYSTTTYFKEEETDKILHKNIILLSYSPGPWHRKPATGDHRDYFI